MTVALALFLYPGLILAVALTLVFQVLTGGQVGQVLRQFSLPSSAEGAVALVSALLAALALAVTPWPFHPAPEWSLVGNPLVLWAALEGAFLIPILPGLLSGSPFVARAASREAQIGVAGRFVIWLAVGISLWSVNGWSGMQLPGMVLLLLAGLAAFPAAASFGPFSAERSLARAGTEEGLDESTTSLLRLIQTLRAAVLLAVLLMGVLAPLPVQPWVLLLLFGALFAVVALGLRQVLDALPRVTLPGALRWCWWRVMPVALVGLVYLLLVGLE